MVNFGLLTAEICWRVWGTPANFNGFRVLAALLHGALWASAKLCGVEQMAPPVFGQARVEMWFPESLAHRNDEPFLLYVDSQQAFSFVIGLIVLTV